MHTYARGLGLTLKETKHAAEKEINELKNEMHTYACGRSLKEAVL